MKSWETRISNFLIENSSERFANDEELINLISELIEEENLSAAEKAKLLKIEADNGLTLAKLADRSNSNTKSLQQWVNLPKDLFTANVSLDIIDDLLTKQVETFAQIIEESNTVTNNLRKQVYRLALFLNDIKKFSGFFLADFQLVIPRLNILSDKLHATTNYLASCLNQLNELIKIIGSLVEISKNFNLNERCSTFTQKLSETQQRCHFISTKLSNTQKEYPTVAKKLSNTKTHYLIASKNIAYRASLDSTEIISSDNPIKRSLAVMGFKPVEPAITAATIVSNKNEAEVNDVELCEVIATMVEGAIVDEKILATNSPISPVEIYKVLSGISESTSDSNSASTSSSKRVTNNASTSTSISFFNEVNKNSNNKHIGKLKQKIDGLLDTSIHPAKDKRLVNLLNNLADSTSLSAAEKFELLQYTAPKGKPIFLTTYVAIALYCERSVTEKVVNLLTAMQNALGTGLDEFRLTYEIPFPYFDYDTIFTDILLYGEIQENIRQELFDFLQKLGVVREVGHDTFIFLRSYEIFNVFDEPLTALCRLRLNDLQLDANVDDFDIYYYQKIAGSGESLTEVEQQKLASILNSASANSTTAAQPTSSASNSFSLTNTSTLTKIVKSLWSLFQVIENFEDKELANLPCAPKLENEGSDKNTEEYNIEDAEEGEKTSINQMHKK